MNKRTLGALLLAVTLLALPAFGQGLGAVSQGPLTGVNCPGAPLLGIDIVNNKPYSCGTNGGGWQLVGGDIFVLAAPGTSTTTASATALNGSSVTIGAGAMNVAGKNLIVEGYGTYTNVTGTPTFSLAFTIGSTAVATCTSTAVTNAVTNFPFHFTFVDTTTTTGASGTDEAHCTIDIVLGASASAAASKFVDNNVAASSAYNHQQANAVTVVALSAGASNVATLRWMRAAITN